VRVVRIVLRPAGLVTVATVVALVIVEWGPAGSLLALVGAVAGMLAVVIASQVGLLIAAPIAGVRVRRVVIGLGPRLADWSRPNRTVVLRAFPVLLTVTVRAGDPPVRVRMWVTALCSTLTELSMAIVAVLVANGPVLRGAAVAGCVTALYSLLPHRSATSTSTGWLLFRLPFAGPDLVRQLDAAPLVAAAIENAHAGELAEAERLAGRLREKYPDLRSAISARIAVLEAMGRYSEAMVLAVRLASDLEQDPGEAAGSFAALAGLACVTVEAGQVDSEIGLATASQALENAATLGYPTYRLNGVRALLELLSGNLDRAIALARLAAGSGDDVLVRADDLATLARAHMAAGDNRAAREALTEAEKLASWWPRVANTRSRLEVT
jgi:membrane-associated protease RseP (regulator of RpoE activity)